MITSSSISYISQMLEEPQNIHDADAESIRLLTETYPYFAPARYMQAAQQHKLEPFSPEMMSKMQLFSGNWLLYNDFLQDALGGEDVLYEAPVAEVPRKAVPVPEIIEDELPEEEEITIAEPEVTTVAEEPIADDIVEEPVIASFNNIDVIADDFIPENTGFIRGKKSTPQVEHAAEKIEDIVDNQAEEHIVVEKAKPFFNNRADWDEKTENLIPPIYTEDYFLHQGMNISNDIPADINKVDNQLNINDHEKSLMVVMSFSEWLMFYKKKKQQEQEEVKDQKELKTMWQKEKLAAAMEEENEEIPENVFEMAVNSITKEENLISESLAEVMVKQGKYDRAIEMYKKLSLRKPQKKAYFARKIEEILKEK